jgi:uncharacterized membrane protein
MPPAEDQGYKMENSMGLLLRTGVLTACAVMLVGAVLYLLRHGGERESFAAFHAEPPAFESVTGIIREAFSGSARGIIQMGALLLIATPVLRVAFAVYGFAREKDPEFVAISLVVLGLLAFGLFGSH